MADLLGLPAISPDEAYLRQTIPAALSGRQAGQTTIVASFAKGHPDGLAWFLCETGIALNIERVDELDRRLRAEDGLGAADLLDAAEPLLCEIEAGLGIDIEPIEVLDSLPPGGIVVTIEALRGTAVVHRARLALPLDIELLPAQAQFAPELLGTVHLPATVIIAGPRVLPHDAATLKRGDLLLLGTGPLPASLGVAGAPPLSGRYDPALRCFRSD